MLGLRIAAEQSHSDLYSASLVDKNVSGESDSDSNSNSNASVSASGGEVEMRSAAMTDEEKLLVRWLNEQAVLHAVDGKVRNVWSDLRDGVFLIHLIAVRARDTIHIHVVSE